MSAFADFDEFQRYLHGLGLFHMNLTLKRMERAAARLTASDRGPFCPVIHVVGTNGKGSVAVFLEALARAHGLRTGLYTSPHFLDVRERLLIDGRLLPRSRWLECANEVLAMQADWSESDRLTYFELLTVLAARAFRRFGAELGIMEAGLGGRWDAIRVFAPELTLFTPIGMDHAAILGPTLADIARDKAQALAPHGLGFTAPQTPEAMDELAARAREVGAVLRKVQVPDVLPPLRLEGAHQHANAALALAAWRELASRHGWAAIAEGGCTPVEAAALGQAFIPGRLQRIADFDPPLILDGAHNPPAITVLRAALDDAGVVPAVLIFACMADKDLDAMRPIIVGLTDGPVFCPDIPGCVRLLRPDELARRLAPGMRGRVQPVANLAVALQSAREAMRTASGGRLRSDAPILICGSLYLLAEFYRLHPKYLGRFFDAEV